MTQARTPHTLSTLRKTRLTRSREPNEDMSELVLDRDIRGCLRADDTYVCDTALALDGDLDLSGGAILVVKGNLTVSGAVTTDETASLIVTGSLSCRHLLLEGNLEVQHDATIGGVLFGFYEAGISRVHGTARAKVALLGNHDFEAETEEFATAARFDNNRRLRQGDPAQLRSVLGDEAFGALSGLMGIPGSSGNAKRLPGLEVLRHL